MLLVFAMLIVVAVGNRNAVVETRASANQYRSTQSFEAAEAGLEWALARLNDDTPIGDDCLPSADPARPSFRERYLRDDGTGFAAPPGTTPASATPLQAACVRGDEGWSCSCPASGAAVVADPEGSATVPVFTLRFTDGPRPGIVRAIASGCTRARRRAMRPERRTRGGRPGRGRARPGRRAARRAGGGTDGGRQPRRRRGRARRSQPRRRPPAVSPIHAGGNVAGNACASSVPPARRRRLVRFGRRELAALRADRFFGRWFGMDRAAWARSPRRRRVACERLRAPRSLTPCCRPPPDRRAKATSCSTDRSSSARPNGRSSCSSPGPQPARRGRAARRRRRRRARLARRSRDTGALVRGAVLVEGGYQGDAAADIVHDVTVLARLQCGTAASPASTAAGRTSDMARSSSPRSHSAAPPCSSRWPRSSSSLWRA